jgi:hypothetical protein
MKHSRLLLASVTLGTLTSACAAGMASKAPAADYAATSAPPPADMSGGDAPVAPSATPATANPDGLQDVNTDAALNTNGSVTATAKDFLQTASAFRRQVYALGGQVFAERIHYQAGGAELDAGATYRVKLKPRILPDLLDWLTEHTIITAQDVNSIIAMESEGDALIVRADVQARVAEIDKQLAITTLDPTLRAALETERAQLMPQVIADPTASAGNTKRVAVLEVTLDPPRRPRDAMDDASLIASARGSMIGLGVLGGGAASGRRMGAGVGIGGKGPVANVEVVGYAADEMDDQAGVMATVGGGMYSKALGGGKRVALNPYVGARIGYAYLSDSYFAVSAEVGLELYKQKGVLLSVSARPTGLIGADSQAAVEGGATLGVAF